MNWGGWRHTFIRLKGGSAKLKKRTGLIWSRKYVTWMPVPVYCTCVHEIHNKHAIFFLLPNFLKRKLCFLLIKKLMILLDFVLLKKSSISCMKLFPWALAYTQDTWRLDYCRPLKLWRKKSNIKLATEKRLTYPPLPSQPTHTTSTQHTLPSHIHDIPSHSTDTYRTNFTLHTQYLHSLYLHIIHLTDTLPSHKTHTIFTNYLYTTPSVLSHK